MSNGATDGRLVFTLPPALSREALRRAPVREAPRRVGRLSTFPGAKPGAAPLFGWNAGLMS